jgi:hypothetical protein
MATCPRCGNDADYLPGDVFTLLTCEFCGDTIDVTDLARPDDAVGLVRLLPAPGRAATPTARRPHRLTEMTCAPATS